MSEAAKRILEAQARLKAARGDIAYRGRKSFNIEVSTAKNPHRAHGLKQHFEPNTCAYELVGILEKLAAKFEREDRFIFAGMDYLHSRCFRGKRDDGKNYSERQFFDAVRLVRELGILSPILRRDGREGMIVAPHEALCIHEGNRCRFIGPTFVNRGKLGLAGRFAMTGDGGWIWFADGTEQWET